MQIWKHFCDTFWITMGKQISLEVFIYDFILFSDKIWVDGVELRHLGMVGCFIRYQIFRSLLKIKVEMELGTQWSIIIPFLFSVSLQNCLGFPTFCPQTCSNVRSRSSERTTKISSTNNWTFITRVRSDTRHSIKRNVSMKTFQSDPSTTFIGGENS